MTCADCIKWRGGCTWERIEPIPMWARLAHEYAHYSYLMENTNADNCPCFREKVKDALASVGEKR